MQTATKQLWAGAAAAFVGSLCCVAPLVLLALGISGAWISRLTALEPYRPIFVGVMLVFLGLAFRQLYIVPANMTCGTCPIVVKKALERVPGVSATSVDLDKKTATVTFDPAKVSASRLTQATTEAGFPSKLIAKP